MRDYCPDKWVIVKIEADKEDTHYRVFGTWYGSYLGTGMWRLSSGIKSCELVDNRYEMPQHSGSHYSCYVNSYGKSAYTTGILESLIRNSSTTGFTITELTEEQAKDLLSAFNV